MKTLFCFALGFLFAAANVGRAAELKVGDDAPNFELQASDGKTYKLSDFKGKSAVVVAWFPRAFTGGCTAECKNMRAEGAKIREYNVAYFTASNDPVEKNTDFAKSLELDYPILSDPTSKTLADYGVMSPRGAATRWTFYIGIDGKILYIDKMVKTATHGADIAAKLGELGVPKKS